jgi:glycosyltransferase involved in cell wall biosynthesis
VIVGPTTDESADKVRSLAREYDISERLILTGFRSDALAVIAAMDVLIVCNHHGVLGRPPLEALAVGTPVAAWHGHSRRSSVVRNGETGLLADRDDVDALTQLVVQLVDNPSLRKKMAEQGMQYARKNFDSHHNTRLVERTYLEVLDKEI